MTPRSSTPVERKGVDEVVPTGLWGEASLAVIFLVILVLVVWAATLP